MGCSRAVVEDGGKVTVNWLVSHGKFQTGGLSSRDMALTAVEADAQGQDAVEPGF